ncbi:hypothetical protein, partial [Acutalibacter muris]|uniref:hypothetical protein n=1 Tax=Acutalibacter muris TaxID=1796620 RepID=UPI00272E1E54
LFFDISFSAIFGWIIFHFSAYLCDKFAPLLARICAAAGGETGAPHKSPQMPQNGGLGGD